MFSTIRNALRTDDIRRRIYFTLLMILIVRAGSQIPVPGVDTAFVAEWWEGRTSPAFLFLDMITGSSFTSLSLFALSVTPYITASIIIQLLTVAIPRMGEWQKEGPEGQKAIKKTTLYLTAALSALQSAAMAAGFGPSLLTRYTWYNVILTALVMTAGSAALVWIGEQITEKGIGNGISMILLANILSGMPSDFYTLYTAFVRGKGAALGILAAAAVLTGITAMAAFVVFLMEGERRIPVQYSRTIRGRRMTVMGGPSSYMPLKVNTAGVIPVIFASSLMSFPGILAGFAGFSYSAPDTLPGHIMKMLTQGYWCDPDAPVYSIGLVIYLGLLVFFSYFYTSITFNPMEMADSLKRQGGMIPGIRPGNPTYRYLDHVLNGLVIVGAAGLAVVAVIPIVLTGLFGIGSSLCFFGTSLVIAAGVILETMKQLESMLLARHYGGLFRD